jgi:hypothetical protein
MKAYRTRLRRVGPFNCGSGVMCREKTRDISRSFNGGCPAWDTLRPMGLGGVLFWSWSLQSDHGFVSGSLSQRGSE